MDLSAFGGPIAFECCIAEELPEVRGCHRVAVLYSPAEAVSGLPEVMEQVLVGVEPFEVLVRQTFVVAELPEQVPEFVKRVDQFVTTLVVQS